MSSVSFSSVRGFPLTPRTKPPGKARPMITVAVGTTIADRPPRRSVRARLRIRLLLWMNGGETCCWPHTAQSLGQAFPALCRTHVGLNDVLLGLCPSLPGLRRKLPFVVRLVHWCRENSRLFSCLIRSVRDRTTKSSALQSSLGAMIFDPVGLFHPLQHAGLSRRSPVGTIHSEPCPSVSRKGVPHRRFSASGNIRRSP